MIANPATIATLDTSNWTNAIQTFEDASNFNQDISGWDTSKITLMTYMFEGATSFNQDISQWCVSLINEKPEGFDTNSGFAGDTAKQPQWGTCPGGENITLPHEYSIEDCHIFVTNSNPVNLPIPDGTTPIFVAVDGVRKITTLRLKETLLMVQPSTQSLIGKMQIIKAKIGIQTFYNLDLTLKQENAIS